ncbi:MAG: hypothetical protein H6711_03720 [Myxococcales bacterium]|nr:hypothetical protein [Myxococcales bacterium]
MPTAARLDPPSPLLPLVGALLLGAAACGDDSVSSASASASEGASSSGSEATSASGGTATTSGSTATTSGGASDSESGATTGGESTSTGSATSGTSDATTDATGTSSTTGSSTGDTDTTTGGDPLVCDDATLPYAGSLCGPPQLPCVIVADEAASPTHAFRNEAPAIAVDNGCAPRILYSVAEGGYFGYSTWREGADQWVTEPTPFELARVALAHDRAADRPLALAYNGAFGTSLWTREGDLWTKIDAVSGQHIASAHAFARGADGRLHASLYGSDNVDRYAVHDGAWVLADVAGEATPRTALTLDPDGAPHLTFWRTVGASWALTYAAPPAAPEILFDLQSNVLELGAHEIAAIPGDNDPLPVIPYVLHARRVGGPLHAVVLSHAVGFGKWESEDVIVEDDKDASLCNAPPNDPGDTCAYDYIRHRPLAIYASAGGDVRLLFLTIHHKGTLSAECVDFPFPMCNWVPESDASAAEVRIGWPTDLGPKWTTLAAGIFAADLTVTVDAGGRAHAAIYDSEGGQDWMVRYLAFE